ncbi:hypothetical protein HII31_10596 [Pseudocercospora fuligena]|uniref:ASST-domain-containing protein n=1 Tax=Pseudocercospora fuligena TaxID=685502 RepID=A0A8H6VH87_9PEZI|nr:hypothetical protein HII31_10596 [Pseudocercospora fuligena]
MNSFWLFLWQFSLCHHVIALALRAETVSEAPPAYDQAVDNGTFGYYPTRSYITAEGVNSPQTNFLQWDPRCNDGSLYFITPRGWGIPNPGPMLLDERGNLVWAKHFDNKFGGQAYDFMVQRYQGEDYLTFWLGDDRVRGHGSGFYYMLNASYDIVHRVGAANGLSADLHEFLITHEGTALMTMYEITEHDVTTFPGYGPDAERPDDPTYIWDCVFQEISIDTGDLIYQWRASEHIDITATYRGIGPGGSRNDPFDWFHLNSIEKDELGNYLISARYPHSITYIDGKTSETIWTLGGKLNDFMDLSGGNATNFAWQHDARFLPIDTFPNMYTPPRERDGFITKLVTLFDNAAEDQHYEYGMPLSRGLLLEVTFPIQSTRTARQPGANVEDVPDLNMKKVLQNNGTNPDYTVRVVKSYENPQNVRSSSQGSMQILPQGPGQDPKVFVGFGLNAVWTEFDADGTVLCDVHYGATTSWERGDIQSYRSYKFQWVGMPEVPPAVDISDDDAEIYVSWNGATEVAKWVLQCSEKNTEDEKPWEDLIVARREDFEASILLPNTVGDSRYLRVIALDEKGRRLPYGTSRVIDRGVVASYMPAVSSSLPHEITSLSPLNILIIAVCGALTVYILLEAYRRYLSWKTGQPSAGPLRWRKGHYRLLSNASVSSTRL